MAETKITLDNGDLVDEDETIKVPSEIEFKIPGDPTLAGDFVKDFLRAGYDIGISQAYSDSFSSPKIDHYRVVVDANLNFEIPEEETDD